MKRRNLILAGILSGSMMLSMGGAMAAGAEETTAQTAVQDSSSDEADTAASTAEDQDTDQTAESTKSGNDTKQQEPGGKRMPPAFRMRDRAMQTPLAGQAPQDQQNNNDGNTTQPEQGSEENAETDDSNKPELHDGNIPNENGARGSKAVSRFFKPNEKPETKPDADKAADDRRDPWGTTDRDPFDSDLE